MRTYIHTIFILRQLRYQSSSLFRKMHQSQEKIEKQNLYQATGAFMIFTNDGFFKKLYGFKLKDYLQQRNRYSAYLRGISDYLDSVFVKHGFVARINNYQRVSTGLGFCLSQSPDNESLYLTDKSGNNLKIKQKLLEQLKETLNNNNSLKNKIKQCLKIIEQLQQKDKLIADIISQMECLELALKQKDFFQKVHYFKKYKEGGKINLKGYKQLQVTPRQVIRMAMLISNINCFNGLKQIAHQLLDPNSKGFQAIRILSYGKYRPQLKQVKQAKTLREISYEFDSTTRQIEDVYNNLSKVFGVQSLKDINRKYIIVSKQTHKLLTFAQNRPNIYLSDDTLNPNALLKISSGYSVSIQNNQKLQFASVEVQSLTMKQQSKLASIYQTFSLTPVKDGKKYEYIIQLKQNQKKFYIKNDLENEYVIKIQQKQSNQNESWLLFSQQSIVIDQIQHQSIKLIAKETNKSLEDIKKFSNTFLLTLSTLADDYPEQQVFLQNTIRKLYIDCPLGIYPIIFKPSQWNYQTIPKVQQGLFSQQIKIGRTHYICMYVIQGVFTKVTNRQVKPFSKTVKLSQRLTKSNKLFQQFYVSQDNQYAIVQGELINYQVCEPFDKNNVSYFNKTYIILGKPLCNVENDILNWIHI